MAIPFNKNKRNICQKKFKNQYCQMCDKETLQEDYQGGKLDRCMNCLWTKEAIKQWAEPDTITFKSYAEEIYVAGDPDN